MLNVCLFGKIITSKSINRRCNMPGQTGIHTHNTVYETSTAKLAYVMCLQCVFFPFPKYFADYLRTTQKKTFHWNNFGMWWWWRWWWLVHLGYLLQVRFPICQLENWKTHNLDRTELLIFKTKFGFSKQTLVHQLSVGFHILLIANSTHFSCVCCIHRSFTPIPLLGSSSIDFCWTEGGLAVKLIDGQPTQIHQKYRLASYTTMFSIRFK